jgi:pimeloyl-ACP methyl ester carboxylesterase
MLGRHHHPPPPPFPLTSRFRIVRVVGCAFGYREDDIALQPRVTHNLFPTTANAGADEHEILVELEFRSDPSFDRAYPRSFPQKQSISSLLFQPPQCATYTPKSRMKVFWLCTRLERRIPVVFIDRKSEHTVLFSHGNAEDLGLVYDWFVSLSFELNVNVLCYDYTGYGLSREAGGVPSEQDVYADAEAALDYLTETLGFPYERIILFGRSLGSGPSVHLAKLVATRSEGKRLCGLCGLILQSPLMSAYRVAFHFRWSLPGDAFCNIDKISNVNCPVLIVHGALDDIVPFWHGQELFKAVKPSCRFKPFWIPGAGHNDIEVKEGTLYVDRLREFFTFLRNTED